jgi:hypothetical protein
MVDREEMRSLYEPERDDLGPARATALGSARDGEMS